MPYMNKDGEMLLTDEEANDLNKRLETAQQPLIVDNKTSDNKLINGDGRSIIISGDEDKSDITIIGGSITDTKVNERTNVQRNYEDVTFYSQGSYGNVKLEHTHLTNPKIQANRAIELGTVEMDGVGGKEIASDRDVVKIDSLGIDTNKYLSTDTVIKSPKGVVIKDFGDMESQKIENGRVVETRMDRVTINSPVLVLPEAVDGQPTILPPDDYKGTVIRLPKDTLENNPKAVDQAIDKEVARQENERERAIRAEDAMKKAQKEAEAAGCTGKDYNCTAASHAHDKPAPTISGEKAQAPNGAAR